MNEAEISRIIGGRNAWQDIQSRIKRWQADPTKPFQLLPEQRRQAARLVQAIQSRQQKKLDVIADAEEKLIYAKTPDEQKRILHDTKKKLHAISVVGLKNADVPKLVEQDAKGNTPPAGPAPAGATHWSPTQGYLDSQGNPVK